MDERQYFIDAALRYEALLKSGQQISLDEFVAREPAATRAELRAFLEFNVTLGELDEPIALTAVEEARADSIIARARAAWAQEVDVLSPRSLVEIRKQRGVTVGRLARQLQLPVDLLARIERGKVAAATLPLNLINRLADALQETTETIRTALIVPPPQISAARLNAADGIVETEEPVVSFMQAFDESDPTPDERAAWVDEMA
jgi:transcriptional regulator with XRE-family HTH domain